MNTKMNKIVVSTSWCSSCSVLKATFDREQIPYTVIDADTEDGMEFCRTNGVKSLPTTFIYNEQNELIKTIIGLKPTEEYL